jgi:hypothetical protein
MRVRAVKSQRNPKLSIRVVACHGQLLAPDRLKLRTPTGPADINQEQPGPADAPRRELKLVVVLRHVDAGYRAHLAVGSDGCDPELRVTDVPDLATALLALTEVAAAAQARWRVEQRYPAAPQPVSPPYRSPAPPSARQSRPVDPAPDATGGGRRVHAGSTAVAPDQLSLFS